jgi:hypothetical protein
MNQFLMVMEAEQSWIVSVQLSDGLESSKDSSDD